MIVRILVRIKEPFSLHDVCFLKLILETLYLLIFILQNLLSLNFIRLKFFFHTLQFNLQRLYFVFLFLIQLLFRFVQNIVCGFVLIKRV